MSIFAVDPERQKDEAAEKVVIATTLKENATRVYEDDPSWDNQIALRAATRLLEETKAEFNEWTDE